MIAMIQPATLPATAKLLLAIDPQAANGETASFDTQFSALMAATIRPPARRTPHLIRPCP
jgi:hypothetical protein